MTKFLVTILIVFFGIPILAQDIHFPSALVAAGESSGGESVNISKWRLAPIHVITLPIDDKKETDKLKCLSVDWKVTIYPNPVNDFAYLEFEVPELKELILKITDALGRIFLLQEARTFSNAEVIELNMSGYIPGYYLIHICSPDLESNQIYPILKL